MSTATPQIEDQSFRSLIFWRRPYLDVIGCCLPTGALFYAPRRKPISTTGAIHSQRLRKVSYFISVVSLFRTLVTHLLLKHF